MFRYYFWVKMRKLFYNCLSVNCFCGLLLLSFLLEHLHATVIPYYNMIYLINTNELLLSNETTNIRNESLLKNAVIKSNNDITKEMYASLGKKMFIVISPFLLGLGGKQTDSFLSREFIQTRKYHLMYLA